MEKAPILQWIKTDEIRIPEKRLRSKFSDSKAKLFRSSVEKEGILQPIEVVEDEEGIKWLVDGQNRLEEWVREGHSIVPVIIKKGSKIDAILGSAKYNLLRGKVNSAELSEFVAYLHNDLKLSYEKICEKLHMSKGYISLLVNLANNKELLEKVRIGEISLKEARNKLSGSTVELISSEKPSFTESVQKKASLEKLKKRRFRQKKA